MTRRSPETRGVHLTRGQLHDALDAVNEQAEAAETPVDRRKWRRLRNKLARELDFLWGPPRA